MERPSELEKVFSELPAKDLASQLLALEEMLEKQEERLSRIEEKLDQFSLPKVATLDNRTTIAPYPS